ncbi:Sodium- and chloride-dependent glycine transporter 2 [Trichinella papuae]|uniref:Sodium-and chloride-dependent glycine transporter 2 n=1 Tax=Trichinella papuae TaxID=268474 RepID=A0A0V1MEC5_9BILA|nr:Sodium- and chloride-dependent glycine transporter 2 [Trichinella papuae]
MSCQKRHRKRPLTPCLAGREAFCSVSNNILNLWSMVDKVSSPNEVKDKEKWASKTEFMLSCLGFAVGLGNIWRFPYLCGRNGGGAAFLLIFIIFIIFGGVPMALLELGLGQYSSLASHQLFEAFCPLFSGLGYVMILTSFLTSLYYNVVIAWAIYYFAASFSSQLPWKSCNNPWNTIACYDKSMDEFCMQENLTYWKGQCWNNTADHEHQFDIMVNWSERTNPAQEYFDNNVLHLSKGIDHLDGLSLELSMCLLAAWVLVFAILIKGVRSAGKVIYFTATVPYMLLLALLVRGATLPNAIEGIKFFIIPDFSRLADSAVWGDAAVQVFFSMSVGAGGLTTLSSYNELDNNIFRDTFVITLGNIFTSLLSGFVVFSILGFMAGEFRQSVESVATAGPGLLFVTYPYALTHLPLSPVWSALFFFTVILMGIDSQIVLVEVVITAFKDQYPKLREPKIRVCAVACTCAISYLIGLLMCTGGGAYILNLLDTFAGGWPLLLQCLLEVIIVVYIYGLEKYANLYRYMLGEPTRKFWKFLGFPINKFYTLCWAYLTPLCLVVVLVFNFSEYTITSYGNYIYPLWAEVIGWLIAFGSCLPAVIVALYKVIVIVTTGSKETIKLRLRNQLTSTERWDQNRKILETSNAEELQTVDTKMKF